MRKTSLYLILISLPFLTFSNTPLFDSEPLVRVRIINTLDSLNMTAGPGWSLHTPSRSENHLLEGQRFQVVKLDSGLALVDSNNALIISSAHPLILETDHESSSLGIAGVPYGVGWWWGGREDRLYGGAIHIYLDSNMDLCVTVHLPLEEYLKGVVPYEIGGNSPIEALKAQAVAARSEAIIALTSKLYNGEHHDLTSDVECQVFGGNHKRTPKADRAVDETKSLILSENGLPINAYYASNCGGHAELIKNVWSQRPETLSYQTAHPDRVNRRPLKLHRSWRFRRWLKSSPQVNCNPEFESSLPSWSKKNFRWTREFTVEEITGMLSQGDDFGEFKKFKVLERGVSGRIYSARLVFEKGSREIQGELALRQLFSPSLRSSAFIVKKRAGRFVIEGAGWGHGVGMCQSGAIALASHGSGFKEILTHYYGGSKLLSVYPS